MGIDKGDCKMNTQEAVNAFRDKVKQYNKEHATIPIATTVKDGSPKCWKIETDRTGTAGRINTPNNMNDKRNGN
jgi:hypothetical protein